MNPGMEPNLQAMAVVGLYLGCTAPFLGLMLFVHGLRSSYTGLFMIAIALQLIPIGLVFFPLGFIGVALLAYTLAVTGRRLRAFRQSNLPNPEVERRWSREYLANLWAFGLALEQKGLALVFVEVTSRRGLDGFWWGLLPFSVVLWAFLGVLLASEWRRLRALQSF
jgi:hypothetical protein